MSNAVRQSSRTSAIPSDPSGCPAIPKDRCDSERSLWQSPAKPKRNLDLSKAALNQPLTNPKPTLNHHAAFIQGVRHFSPTNDLCTRDNTSSMELRSYRSPLHGTPNFHWTVRDPFLRSTEFVLFSPNTSTANQCRIWSLT